MQQLYDNPTPNDNSTSQANDHSFAHHVSILVHLYNFLAMATAILRWLEKWGALGLTNGISNR